MAEQDPDHADVLVPPPLVFLGYLGGALLLNWTVPFPAPWLPAVRPAGGGVALGGFLLAAAAVLQMRRAHTSPDPGRPVTALVTAGPYGFTRNPIYLGFLLIYLGATMLGGTLWGLIASPFLVWTVTRAVIRAEEIYLEANFNEEYRRYRAAVRRWL